MQKFARSAEFVVWNESEFLLAQVAVTASAYGVRVVVGDSLLFDTRIEMEDALCVLACRFLAESHCLVVRSHRVFGLSHLYDGAAAVPSVRRIVLLPERVVDGQRDTIEGSMFWPHLNRTNSVKSLF